LGEYRRNHITPSRGKRSRAAQKEKPGGETAHPEKPPVPELSASVDVGLANVTRALEKSGTASGGEVGDEDVVYSAVFVVRSGHPPAFSSHFPQMVAAASQRRPGRDAVRLVGFSKSCEERLGACIGIPRVSTVGLREGAPQSRALVDFIRARVPPVEVAWLDEAKDGKHLPTKINSAETTIGAKKQRKSPTGPES